MTVSVAVVGAPIVFKGGALGLTGKPLEKARYIWSFGDGSTKEGQNITHTYRSPGEYVAVLNVASGEYSASDRIIIKAIPAGITISSVGTNADFYIELFNDSSYELNLSGWLLKSGNKYFVIPHNTFILSKKKLIFSSEVTGLPRMGLDMAALLYPNGRVVHSFSEAILPPKIVSPIASEIIQPKPKKILEENRNIKQEISNVIITPIEGIEDIKELASVYAVAEEQKDSFFSKWFFAMLAFIAIAVTGFIFTRGRRNLSDEFEIIEDK